MDFLRNPLVRFIIAALLAWASLMLHQALGPSNPVGMVLIYLFFVGLAWAGARFAMPYLGKAFLFAIPTALIPPAVLLPLRNTLDSGQLSWIIGFLMAVYSIFMIGWMIAAFEREHPAAASQPG